MIVKIIFLAIGLQCGLGVMPGLAPEAHAAKGTFWDRDQILRDFFPDADTIESTPVRLTPDVTARLKSRLGYTVTRPGDLFPLWTARKSGLVVGYAVIDEEKGMHEPITFAVLVGADGVIRRQEVMVYREPEGDGVTQKRFRRQFVGKTSKDPLRAGVDITIVSGATISSHSMAVGVKRAVSVVEEVLLADSPHAAVERPRGRLPDSGT